MSYLGVLLDQVKRSDIEIFQKKVESMEADKKQLLIDSGLQSMDMVVEERREEITTRLADGEKAFADLKVSKLNPDVPKVKPGGDDMLMKFMEVIKG